MQNEQGSVMAVFEAAAQYGEISRAELSDVTGFSRVTVGKAVDLLCSCNILTESKKSSGTVGRRSGFCSLADGLYMLLYMPKDKGCLIRVYDLALNVVSEYNADSVDMDELAMNGIEHCACSLGGMPTAVGCTAADDSVGYYSIGFSASFDHIPNLIVSDRFAYASANAARLDAAGTAFMIRCFADGRVDGAVTYDGRIYGGAHGRAGDFSYLSGSFEHFASELSRICSVTDPSLIHVACENENVCSELENMISSTLLSMGYDSDNLPRTVVEPMSICRSALDGAARLLREKLIISKCQKIPD